MGSKMMGTCAVLAFRAPRRRIVRSAAILPTFSGASSLVKVRATLIPVVALHRAIGSLRDRDRCHGTIRSAVFADETVRVGENFVSGGGVEGSAFGVFDAGIEVERGLFGAAGVVDAIGSGKRIDIFVIEGEVPLKLAELIGGGDTAEGIFGGDLGEFERGVHHAVEAGFGEIAGVGAGGALSEEDADSDGFGAGFFQSLGLAEADEGGEFVTFADDAFGGGGTSGHGAADDVGGDFAKVGGQFGGASFEFS